jgi:hypothetical protein
MTVGLNKSMAIKDSTSETDAKRVRRLRNGQYPCYQPVETGGEQEADRIRLRQAGQLVQHEAAESESTSIHAASDRAEMFDKPRFPP